MDPRISYYDTMLAQYGPDDPRALAWRDAESQQMRFEIIAQIADLSGARILDEGCGIGDLYPFLSERFQNISYMGIDLNPKLIEAAKDKYPAADFAVSDFSTFTSEPFDYVLASGTLTFKVPDYHAFYFTQIRKMYELSTRGVAFNFLNSAHFAGNDLYVTYSREEMFDFCRTLTENITVREDYSPEDYTFYLYH